MGLPTATTMPRGNLPINSFKQKILIFPPKKKKRKKNDFRSSINNINAVTNFIKIESGGPPNLD